jgi:putative PIN family toxin of toxin-antitoxin system
VREIGRVLAYEKIRSRRWMTGPEVEALLDRLAQGAFLVSGARRVRICRDPSGDKFLDAALAGSAQYVVSGDLDLTALETHGEIRIVTPRRFLEMLGASSA